MNEDPEALGADHSACFSRLKSAISQSASSFRARASRHATFETCHCAPRGSPVELLSAPGSLSRRGLTWIVGNSEG